MFPEISDEEYDDLDIYDNYSGEGNKMLGYPFFTQEDPRGKDSPYDILLLQIDTSEFVIWGDGGVCNFFSELPPLTYVEVGASSQKK